MSTIASTSTSSTSGNDLFRQEQAEYEEFVKGLGPECYDMIGDEQRPNKAFYRAIGRRFDIDVVKLSEESELVQCNPDTCPQRCTGNHYEVRWTVRATRRDTGRQMDADGSCVDNDKWLPRSKRCYGRQLKAVIKALRQYPEEDALRMVSYVSENRSSQPHHLNPMEAKALLDFIYGSAPALEPPMPIRNSRHNVRSTARTRAVNRAISDLMGDGRRSAEEHTQTDFEADNAADDAQTNALPQRRTQPPAPAPTSAPAKMISPFQKKRIENHPVFKAMSDAQRLQFVSDTSNAQACELDKLTMSNASKIITALDAAGATRSQQRVAR